MIGWMKVAFMSTKNIFVLPFNEVEMLLVDEAVVKSCLPFDDDKEKQRKFENFQQSIIESCREKKDKIISLALKKDSMNFWKVTVFKIINLVKRMLKNF